MYLLLNIHYCSLDSFTWFPYPVLKKLHKTDSNYKFYN